MTQLTKQNGNRLFPILALLAWSGVWGVIWYPYRLLTQTGINGAASTTIAYAIALILGLILFRKSIRSSLIFNGDAHLLFWIGFFAGWANIAYIIGIVYGEIIRVLLLFYLAPLWTILFSRCLLNERLSMYGYFLITLSLTGAITILWHPENPLPLPSSFGDWVGLLGGFLFALTNVLIRKDQRHNIQLKSIAVWMGITLVGLVCTQFFDTAFGLTEISFDAWLILLSVGFMMFLTSVALQYGLTHTPANQAAVILLFEVVVATITAYYIANEFMTLQEWVGGIMIISAALFSAKMNRT